MIPASARWTRAWSGLPLVLALASLFLAACSDQGGRKGPGFGAAVTGVSTNGQFNLIISLNPNTTNKGGTVGITVTMQTLRGAPIADRRVNLSTTGGVLAAVFGLTDPAGKLVTSLHVPPDYAGANPITVSALADGLRAEAQVLINDLGALAIVPPGPLTLAPGDRQTFNCVGGVPPYRWEPSGGTLNTHVGDRTIYTAGSAVGTFFLKCADSGGNSASVQINISLGAGGLALTPGDVTLIPGQTQIFQASGGRRPYSWTATGGTPTSAGDVTQFAYTAGATPGEFTVALRDSTGQTLTRKVTIKTAELTFGPDVEVTITATGTAPGSCAVSANSIVADLTVAGGAPPYNIFAAAGTITPLTSLSSSPARARYTGPSTATSLAGGTSANVDVVTAIDSLGTRKDVTVKVTCAAVPAP